MSKRDLVRLRPSIMVAATVRCGLLRREVGFRAQIGPVTVARAYRGDAVSIRTAKAMARALRVSYSDLIEAGQTQENSAAAASAVAV